jgi:hypothetical protein
MGVGSGLTRSSQASATLIGTRMSTGMASGKLRPVGGAQLGSSFAERAAAAR